MNMNRPQQTKKNNTFISWEIVSEKDEVPEWIGKIKKHQVQEGRNDFETHEAAFPGDMKKARLFTEEILKEPQNPIADSSWQLAQKQESEGLIMTPRTESPLPTKQNY
ncbi:hypothetical protein AWENTII_002669 [Aspergillus wentii]